MHHWTEHSLHVHVFTCVLALQIAQLMRRQAAGTPGWIPRLLANCSAS